jgi:hypothetical protein
MNDEDLIQKINDAHKDNLSWLDTNDFDEPRLESGRLSCYLTQQYYDCTIHLYPDGQTGGMISVYETPLLDDIVKATNKTYEDKAKSIEHECEQKWKRMMTEAELARDKLMYNLNEALPSEAELVNIGYKLKEKYNTPNYSLKLKEKEETDDKRVEIKKGDRSAEDTYRLIRKVSKVLGVEPERDH